MKQFGARKRGERHGDSPSFLMGERRSGSRLIMVLDESDQFPLVGLVGAEMESHLLRGAMLQPIVQPLIVAVVESCC